MESEMIMEKNLQSEIAKKSPVKKQHNENNFQIVLHVMSSLSSLHNYAIEKIGKTIAVSKESFEINTGHLDNAKQPALQDTKCEKCGGETIESSSCRECRNVLHTVCVDCNSRVLSDIHEWCYCQLEILTVPVTFQKEYMS